MTHRPLLFCKAKGSFRKARPVFDRLDWRCCCIYTCSPNMWAEAAAETNYWQSIFSLMADFWKSCGPLIFFSFTFWNLAPCTKVWYLYLKTEKEGRKALFLLFLLLTTFIIQNEESLIEIDTIKRKICSHLTTIFRPKH